MRTIKIQDLMGFPGDSIRGYVKHQTENFSASQLLAGNA